MRIPEPDNHSNLSSSYDSVPEAGPSCVTLDKASHSNGINKENGYSAPVSNGTTSNGSPTMGNGLAKHSSSIPRVSLPGTTLYDDPYLDREEFVRLVIQSLRDVGYIESAATLEAESGYSLEAPVVSEFRQHILRGAWAHAEPLLVELGVTNADALLDARFLIGKQKYLELLEARKTTAALQVLRNDLAPYSTTSEQGELHVLSSLMMCSDPQDLRRRASWDGASGISRRQLLDDLQHYIPSSTMIPQRRFSTLLAQSREYQRYRCLYHNSLVDPSSSSLFSDHTCDKESFPRITTTILEVHSDEVWNVAWSHDGTRLASASKDKTAIIWRIGLEAEPSSRDCIAEFILRDHPYPVGCLAWSLDDSILSTSADHLILLWNTKTGALMKTLENHAETVSALVWLPDGSGFMSGSLDRKIILWDMEGELRESWNDIAIRVTDAAVTPDVRRLVAVGMGYNPPPTLARANIRDASPPIVSNGNGNAVAPRSPENRMIIYDLKTGQVELSVHMEGELTSVKISEDSRYALINHAPDASKEIHLWDLEEFRLARKFTGQRQGHHVIRSCFGGIDGNFVVSGSEDRNVYVWHRDTGTLLEVLEGHGLGSVNSVAWNPRNKRMFASCSDDNTIRVWEAPASAGELLRGFGISAPEPEMIGKGKGKVKQPWAYNDGGL
ncbi:WD40 repeat-like protein [Suillus subaureus]|uniref:WD40 repeat-like protein n=1 Tax=Suillus subaureus TaxID=48587 RepID=A0A9P7JJM2_9AGAM|nr:WD40 repeat-like protein [Suillus subaureus]KAG1826914.1 WD40 repeat-like protein [Suillus subaureus]